MNEGRNNNLTAANTKGAESFTVRGPRIVTLNLHLHGPRLCRRPAAATFELRRFVESSKVQETCIVTMNRLEKRRRPP